MLSVRRNPARRDREVWCAQPSCAQYAMTKIPGKSIVDNSAYTASCGTCVRTGRRQSIPSSSIDSCAGVKDTVPLVACGQMNLPLSSLFAKRHDPSPSNHRTLIKSPRLPRKIYTWPENGLSWSALCTIPLNPVNPRRRSVTPATIQIRVPAASPIIAASVPAPRAVLLHPHCRRRKYVRWEIPPGSCPLQRPSLAGFPIDALRPPAPHLPVLAAI